MTHHHVGIRSLAPVLALLVAGFAQTSPVEAQSTDDAAALADAAQNPLASVIGLPLQWNSNFGTGEEERTQNVALFQPVVPFSIGGLTLITRHILPIINQPALTGDGPATGPVPLPPGRPDESFDRATGLGDYSGTFWLSPPSGGGVSWGLGPTVLTPTATRPAFGADQWGAGPSGVVVWSPSPWMIAVIASNTWSFAGNDEREDVNQFYSQVVVNYNLDKGWYLTSAPTITADWNQESENRWMVPLGGGVGRVLKIGSVPNDIKVQAFGYVAKPEHGPSWTLQFTWKVMFIK